MSRVNEPGCPPAQPCGGTAGDQGVVFVINGADATVYYGSQQADDGGVNVTGGGPASGPVTVSGPGGSAVGGQSAQAGRDATVAGRDAARAPAKRKRVKKGWWARLRERGMIATFATIAGAIAAVIAAAVAVCAWTGWTP